MAIHLGKKKKNKKVKSPKSQAQFTKSPQKQSAIVNRSGKR